MFGHRFFSARFFAPRYFPPVSGAVPPTPPPPPESVGGQWYDLKWESEWVRDHNNEWRRRIVQTEDWIEDWIIAIDDDF